MRDISTWSGQGVVLALIQRRGANILLVFRAALPLLAVLLLPLGNCAVSAAAAESAATSTPDGAATAGDTDAYLAQLRTALPQSWLQREFQRQRSFSAFAHSRQLVAKGQYEEAFEELKRYLASDPDDLVIQFGTLLLATDLKRYSVAIGAVLRSVQPTGSLLTCPILHRHYFTAGSPGRLWARTRKRYR